MLVTVAALLFAVGCYEEPVAITTFPPDRTPVVIGLPPTMEPTPTAPLSPSPSPPPPTATAIPLPTAPPSPSPSFPAAFGTPSPGCVFGWISPQQGSIEYDEALAILSAQMGVEGSWTVTEMRYFVGPEVPWILSNPNPVERWYVRAALVDDPNFRGRWLIEKRSEEVMGVAAVAPWESFGYESPDWTGFVGEGEPQNYLGLPGQWSGRPYDFVTGEGDSGNPGLPDAVVDCLLAT
jgi:hypothetical protein